VTMTSVVRELGPAAPDLESVAGVVAASFGEIFSREPSPLEPGALEAMLVGA
jgi:hypothetical protein